MDTTSPLYYGGSGVTVNDSSGGVIADVSVTVPSSGRAGFFVLGTDNVHYNHNVSNFNVNGLPVRYYVGLIDATIDGQGADTHSVYCVSCSNTVIRNYSFPSTSGEGVRLWDGDNVDVTNITATGPTQPLHIWKSSGTVVHGNVFNASASLSVPSVQFSDAEAQPTRFYNNSVRSGSPPVRVFSDGGELILSDPLPLGGNHWPSYDEPSEGCYDENNDHICDEPYEVPSGGSTGGPFIDYYPWTSPDAWENVPKVAQCADGVDNDNDGLADADDPGCHTNLDVDSYDSTIDNENPVAATSPLLEQLTAQTEFEPALPISTASNLLVLVHGCCNEDTDVQAAWNTLGTHLAAATRDNDDAGIWDTVVWNWHEDTPAGGGPLQFPQNAYVAYNNAFDQGIRLGANIHVAGYDHVHFVAHSAGANLIDSAIRTMKRLTGPDEDTPTIHATFLDAAVPWWVKNSRYGGALEGRDYGEQYFHNGDLPMTESPLTNAYNFDVTALNTGDTGLSAGHSWPVVFYQNSADTADLYRHGFPRAFERTTAGTAGMHFSALRHSLLFDEQMTEGGVCVLTSEQDCAFSPFYSVQDTVREFLLTLDMVAEQVSPTGTAIELGTSLSGFVLELITGSPVWYTASFETDASYNVLTFDYQFISEPGAEGVLTVFVDDVPVYKADERTAGSALQTALEIPVHMDGAGTHTISFRVDPHTDVQSKTRISGVRFAQIEDVEVVDEISPHTNAVIDGTLQNTGIYASPVVVTLAAEDNEGGSGVRATQYSLDGGVVWHAYTEPLAVTDDGTYELQYRSADNLANIEEVQTVTLRINSTIAPNLLTNAGFETSDGWRTGFWTQSKGLIARTTTEVHTGNYAYVIDGDGAGSSGQVYSDAVNQVTVTPGVRYTYSAWYKGTNAYMVIKWFDGSGNEIVMARNNFGLEDSSVWQYAVREALAPASAKTAWVFVQARDSGAPVYYDDLLFGEAPTQTPTSLNNPGFETESGWLSGFWTVDKGVHMRTTADAHTGNYAFLLDGDTSQSGGQVYSDVANRPAVTAGADYRFTAWYKGKNVYLVIKWLDDAGNEISGSRVNKLQTDGTSWREGSATVTAPAGATYAWLFVQSRYTSEPVHVDDIAFSPVES